MYQVKKEKEKYIPLILKTRMNKINSLENDRERKAVFNQTVNHSSQSREVTNVVMELQNSNIASGVQTSINTKVDKTTSQEVEVESDNKKDGDKINIDCPECNDAQLINLEENDEPDIARLLLEMENIVILDDSNDEDKNEYYLQQENEQRIIRGIGKEVRNDTEKKGT